MPSCHIEFVPDMPHRDDSPGVAELRLFFFANACFCLDKVGQRPISVPEHIEIFLGPTLLRFGHAVVIHIRIDPWIPPPSKPILVCAKGRLQREVVCIEEMWLGFCTLPRLGE